MEWRLHRIWNAFLILILLGDAATMETLVENQWSMNASLCQKLPFNQKCVVFIRDHAALFCYFNSLDPLTDTLKQFVWIIQNVIFKKHGSFFLAFQHDFLTMSHDFNYSYTTINQTPVVDLTMDGNVKIYFIDYGKEFMQPQFLRFDKGFCCLSSRNHSWNPI